MTQTTTNTHLALIQKLLACPRGREWSLLRQNDNLLTPEFIQTMNEVIAQLEAENSLDAARFLQLWRNKLIQALASTQTNPTMTPTNPTEPDRETAYLQLIRALFDCRKGAESHLLTANRHLVDQGLVQTMQEIAAKLLEQGDHDTATFLARLAQDLQAHLADHDALTDAPASTAAPPDMAQPDRAQPVQPAATDVGLVRTQTGDQLQAQMSQILAALHQLETQSAQPPQPTNPLWYMEVLERACEAEWHLSSDEVEQLIGVHPQCGQDESGFQRGCWWFEKSDMIGHQNAWRVMKRIHE